MALMLLFRDSSPPYLLAPARTPILPIPLYSSYWITSRTSANTISGISLVGHKFTFSVQRLPCPVSSLLDLILSIYLRPSEWILPTQRQLLP